MSNRAWVTLATNDSYGLGALVLAHSLRRVASSYPAVVLITPSVTEPMRERLRAVFSEVILVDVLDSKDAAHLALLQRPELGVTFTKIHCWNLTQYEKCVFLDADALIVQNCDELFEREELSAAPDVGWPDCFNSGVFVFIPSADTFSKLIAFASERGSFDGGDQGLLNSYFSDWAHGDINKHLPFLYNVTSAAFYSYIPALKHYGQSLKIIHFIGANKPWLQNFNWQSRSVEAPEHLRGFLQLWWDLFVAQVHSQLDIQMAVEEEVPLAIESEETTEYHEPIQNYGFYEPILDPSSEFPWHHPDNQTKDTEFSKPDIDMSQFHDPWNIYKGNIPPSNSRMEPTESQRQYAWDYTHPQEQHYTSGNSNNFEQSHKQHEQSSHNQNINIWQYTPECISEPHNIQQTSYSGNPQHDNTQHSTSFHNPEHHYTLIQEPVHEQNYQRYSYQQSSSESHNQQDQSHHNQYHTHRNHHDFNHQQNSNYENYSNSHHQDDHYQNSCHQRHFETYQHEQNESHNHQHFSKHDHLESQHTHNHSNFEVQRQSVHNYEETENSQSTFCNFSQSNSIENSKNVINNEKINHSCRENVETSYRQFQRQKQSQHVYTVMMDYERAHSVHIRNLYLNGCQMECHTTLEEIPRHPYDGFYLRHRATIDSRGRKICIHEIPLSLPSPTPSLESSSDYDDAIETFEDEINLERLNGHGSHTGVAGNLAKVVPGAPQQQQAVDELTRRQGWEAGIIDYMGVDSFDNIWAKISQTLSQPPRSPPRQPSPPKEQFEQPSGASIVEAEEVLIAPIESKPDDSAKGTTPSEGLLENSVAVEAPVEAPQVVAPNDVSVSTEKPENIAPIDAVETVAPTETTESVPLPEAPACVSPSEASDCVSPPEVPETVAHIEATESVFPSEAPDCVPAPEVPETVAQIEATESVSPSEALENVASIEAPSVSPASENVLSVTKEIVAISEANVAPIEATENVSSPDASISEAAEEKVASSAEAIAPELIETKETIAPPEAPAPAASVEEPVGDVPVPASEAAEISGKQEDSIPVPVETAAVLDTAPSESNEGTELPDNIPVTAEEALKIDIASSAKPSEILASAPETESRTESIDKTMSVSESSIDKNEAISEPSPDKKVADSDSPPLANTPSKEDIPIAPAAKTEERRKPAGKLMLPPASCDTLPTPDSELEDAATLAHAIIAGELRTPTVTSPSPPVVPSPSQAQPTQAPPRGLSVDQPDVQTPPVESSQTSLSQIGVKSKPTIASQIETSVSKTESSPTSDEPKQKSDAPKKKVIKKVIKKVDKEGASSGDAPVPVPPPRKKEKKPKEK